MTLIATTPGTQATTPEQVYEIQSMAEGGQFADALIRLRKIKATYPHNTFFVALEKQLERLLVLPRDSEPSEAQKSELLDSLPGLIQGAVQAMQQRAPVRPAPPPPRAPAERVDRESARSQLREQYFKHADEYLKKGAYGSALVEIRRVKIIAPDDKTALEYERTIRQLVELQQRTGIRHQEEQEAAAAPPPAAVPEEHTPLVFGEEPASPEPAPGDPVERAVTPHVPRRRGKGFFLGLLLAVAAAVVTTGIIVSATGDTDEQTVTPAGNTSKPISPKPRAVPAMFKPQVQTEGEQRPPAAVLPDPGQDGAGTSTSRSNSGPDNTVPAPVPAGGSHEQRDGVQVRQADQVVGTPVVQAQGVRDPEIVRLEQPVFSPEALAIPGGGEVIIMVQIDPDGKPIKTLVAKSTNPAFNQPIVSAVLNSTYRPGTTAAGPSTKWLTIPFTLK